MGLAANLSKLSLRLAVNSTQQTLVRFFFLEEFHGRPPPPPTSPDITIEDSCEDKCRRLDCWAFADPVLMPPPPPPPPTPNPSSAVPP